MLENKYNVVIEGEPEEVTEIRQKILDSFKDLVFIEDGHKYFLNGKPIPSVTTITHRFKEEFDENEAAEKYALKHGETTEHWLKKWNYSSVKATTKGTLVHSFGESLGWLKNGHPELITDECRHVYIEDKGWLIPTRPQEESIIQFYEDLPDNFHFVLAETKVYTGLNKELTNLNEDYCGTFDLLFYYKHPLDDSKSGLIIMDFKTNASLEKEYSRAKGKMMFPPFEDLYDESLGSYVLQLSAYQIPLEDIGLKVIGRRIIWLKSDGTYEKISVPNVTDKLRNVL